MNEKMREKARQVINEAIADIRAWGHTYHDLNTIVKETIGWEQTGEENSGWYFPTSPEKSEEVIDRWVIGIAHLLDGKQYRIAVPTRFDVEFPKVANMIKNEFKDELEIITKSKRR